MLSARRLFEMCVKRRRRVWIQKLWRQFRIRQLFARARRRMAWLFSFGHLCLTPSNDAFKEILKFSDDQLSLDSTYEALFNLLHPKWRTKPGKQLLIWYDYPSNTEDLKEVVHFLESRKDWNSTNDTDSDDSRFPLENFWWEVFKESHSKEFEGTDLRELKNRQRDMCMMFIIPGSRTNVGDAAILWWIIAWLTIVESGCRI